MGNYEVTSDSSPADTTGRNFVISQPRNFALLPVLAIITGLALLAASTMMLLKGVEPFATWYYNFAWYPVLLAGDGVIALTGGAGRRKRGEFLLLGRKSFLLSVLAWSSVVWLFYELFNFRLQNWYYVFLPENRIERWIGTLLAFATVLPAVFVAEGILDGLRVAERTRWPRFNVGKKVIAAMRIAGLIMLALVLAWPYYFFPLVWGATMLLVEPENFKRDPERSLLADLSNGRPGRLLRLLLGGAAIGFTWELLNINARGKWIYTVPGLENVKLFEMPVAGFFGFPPFAVECFILWQALVLAGVAVPRWGSSRPATTTKRVLAGAAAAVFCVGVLWGMEQLTIDSYTPQLSELPDVPASRLTDAGYNVFSLSRAHPGDVADAAQTDATTAQVAIDRARLASLRGLGSDNVRLLSAIGITSIEHLAQQDPKALIAKIESFTGEDVVDARVRVWIRGARRAQSRLAPAAETSSRAQAKRIANTDT
jgi:hypothetical protein